VRHPSRFLAAGVLATVLVLTSVGCAKESPTTRFCNKFDESQSLLASIDYPSKDPNSIKVYTKAVDDLIAATNSAPAAIHNDSAKVATDGTDIANKVLAAETQDRAQAQLLAAMGLMQTPAALRVAAYMTKNCGFDSTGPSS
jgi:hypothetical protein